MQLLLEAMHRGGFFMWPILAMAVFALAIAMERILYVLMVANLNGPAFAAEIQKAVLVGDLDRAIALCNSEVNAALPRVLKAALSRANRGDQEIRDAVEETILEVFPQLSRRTGYLPMLANVATLTGLLGTIQGLIIAFQAVANAPPETKQLMLASGIAVAMFTTFGGLLVAIPTLVFHGIVVNNTNRIMDEIDLYSLKLVNLLAARRRVGLAQEGPSPDHGTLDSIPEQ